MKKRLIQSVLLPLLSVLTFALYAQEDLSEKLLPIDDKIRIGKLDNGFTYYIRQNYKPEKRVEMRLVVDAGSVLEDDDQRGLAHFVEHMAFNGTKHFEKNELKDYLESLGIRFGAELNAYTSFEETVYMLTIPSDSIGLLEQGFVVMDDWASGLSFAEEEIDKERGVIIEEWRMGQGYSQRMSDQYYPVLFKGAKHAKRLPIGLKEIIEGCDYETLRRYYRDWYRPDLMALVVVGDIDVDYAEKKIIEQFSDFKMPSDARERTAYEVPHTDGTHTCIVSDEEAPYTFIYVVNKHEAEVEKTYADYLDMLRQRFVSGMLSRRVAELTELKNPPFVASNFALTGIGARNLEVFLGFALVSETGVERGLNTLLVEMERVDEHGFTQAEMDRYKLDLMKQYENQYNERDKTESRHWADEYKRNFLTNEPIPGIEFEYEFVKAHIDDITLVEINKLADKLITDDNRVVIIGGPEGAKDMLPTEERVLALSDSIASSQIEAYTEEAIASELLAELPEPGTITSEKKIESIEAYDLTLSNGTRVLLKPTAFKNNQILYTAFSKGGQAMYGQEDHFSALNADGIIQESGVADFSNSDLSKVLAGKSLSVKPGIGQTGETLQGSCKTSDLESMLQLNYLYATQPRVDREAFESYISKKKSLFENQAKEPQNYFFDQYNRIKSQHHPRGNYLPTEEDWAKVDFERAIQIYQERFADASDFTYVFVGSFEVDSIKPLLEQYIASLPATNSKEESKDLGIRPPAEKTVKNIHKGNDPKSLALVYFEKEAKWNAYDAFMVGVITDILRFRFVDVLREEMSGVYTSRASTSFSKYPYEKASLQIIIPCAPENVDSLVSTAISELARIQNNGVEDSYIQKAIKTRKRVLETDLEKNRYWLDGIKKTVQQGKEFSSLSSTEYIDKISSEELQRVAQEYFDIDRYLQVVLYPEENIATKE